MVLSLSNTSVHAVISPGSACNPATLGQALNLGFTTNQFGVSNPGTSSFFVVCPIHRQSDGIFDTVFVGAELTDPTGGEIDCVVRLAEPDNANLNAFPLTLTRGTAGYEQTNIAITIESGFDVNGTIVCALEPGETIIWYALD